MNSRVKDFENFGFKSNFKTSCRYCGNKDTRVDSRFNYAKCIDCFHLPNGNKLFFRLDNLKDRWNKKEKYKNK